jgi:hypothetical protein
VRFFRDLNICRDDGCATLIFVSLLQLHLLQLHYFSGNWGNDDDLQVVYPIAIMEDLHGDAFMQI